MLHLLHPQERRQHRRLPASELKAQLKSKQGLFSKWIDLNVTDFSPRGLALVLSSEPELGKKFTLRLILEMEMADIKINQIEAKIVNKIKQSDGEWRIGLIFSNQSKHSKETQTQLKRFQTMLEKNEMISERLNPSKTG